MTRALQTGMGSIDWKSGVPVAIVATFALAVLTALATRALLLRLPVDVLEPPRSPVSRMRVVLRTAGGVGLVGAGLLLLVLPGPGILVLAVGALMLTPSWRSRIMRSIMRRPRFIEHINAFRRRHGREDLDISSLTRDR